jgi:hypothetical protein
MATTDITIYFGLSKGEGAWPQVDQLSSREVAEPESFCFFSLHLDEGAERPIFPCDIVTCRILYNGISPVVTDDGVKLGLRVEGDSLIGKPRPIINFQLSKAIEPEDFRRGVWASSYLIKPAQAEEAFYAEDWNGYTEVFSKKATQNWEKMLKKNKVYSGKIFSAEQMIQGVVATLL